MSTLKNTVLLGLALACSATIAQANLTLNQVITTGAIGSGTSEATYVSGLSGVNTTLTYLTKADSGSFENGAISGGIIGNPSGSSATVSWNLANSGFQLNYVLVKDGAVAGGTGGTQYYELYKVSSDEMMNSGGSLSISLSNGKDISHITYLGTTAGSGPGTAPGPSVPDGGSTLALIGMGLTTLGFLRRKLS